ncbi:MAG: TetR/AcrR family transcriptional regulator [Paraprevotella sp.]|jgi:AcrR family transcriptional regulator|nr:TetR/AcrR family transcriptional regulator [Paraprevotella sp.]MBR0362154.1 TetR/AcrR family transcriptional regulator [Paraprevotella sp.]
MAISRTKIKIVEVARQLFAKQGLDNTTMNDIAVASGKGRRTLYTYFKNKEDVFSAVIETELGHLSEMVAIVVRRQMSLEDKLVEFIFAHLSLIKEVVLRNGNLRAEFFRNIWMVEKVRKNFDQAEVNFFVEILEKGNETGEFSVENIPLVADVLHYCVKGLEVPYIYGRLGEGLSQNDSRKIVKTLIHRALKGD